MSARRKRPSPPARALLALYPHPWRERYGAEMRALLENDPPGPRGLLSLVQGAAVAHLRPRSAWRDASPPLVRVRLSLSGLFACWIALSVLGMAFQKETEEADFVGAASYYGLLAVGKDMVIAGALAGAATIAFAGLPLVWLALRDALRRRDRRLALLLVCPLLAILAYAAVSLVLIRIAPAREGHFAPGFVLGMLVPWQLAGVACAVVLAFAPRAVLARMTQPPRALRRAARATPLLAAATVAIACGLALYTATLALRAPALAGLSSGPVGASTVAMLAAESALAAVICVPAAVCARRALAAAR